MIIFRDSEALELMFAGPYADKQLVGLAFNELPSYLKEKLDGIQFSH
jgi:hypothetical protein